MIDFWEALGRLAYDKDLFDKFQEKLGPPTRLRSERVTENKVTATVLNISEKAYEAVQDFFGPILAEQFVSLFVAGELIWTFSWETTRDALAKMHGPISAMKFDNPPTSYFIALGLILVDARFRDKVATSTDNCVRALPRLSQPQRDHLVSVVKNRDFLANMDDFEDPWDEGCFEWLMFRREYVHPVAVDPMKGPGGRYLASSSRYPADRLSAEC